MTARETLDAPYLEKDRPCVTWRTSARAFVTFETVKWRVCCSVHDLFSH
jgi:hypothetical protein